MKVRSLVDSEYSPSEDRFHLWLLSTNVLGRLDRVLDHDGRPVDLGCYMHDLQRHPGLRGAIESRAKRAVATMAAMDAAYP